MEHIKTMQIEYPSATGHVKTMQIKHPRAAEHVKRTENETAQPQNRCST